MKLLPTPLRALIIFHLSLALFVLTWSGGQPFMGDLYRVKSRLLLSSSVMESPQFSRLPAGTKQEIQDQAASLEHQLAEPFLTKLSRAWHIICFQIPPLKLTWVIASIILSLLLLLRVDGAHIAIGVLPILALFYSIDNFYSGTETSPTREERLFPSEEILVKNYLDQPLSPSILEQKKELTFAWEKYLQHKWGDLFSFQVARMQAIQPEELLASPSYFQKRQPLVVLGLFLAWNCLFACIIYVGVKRTYVLYSALS